MPYMDETRSAAPAINTPSHNETEGLAAKIGRVFHEESRSIQPRFLLIYLLTSLIPRYAGGRLRTRIIRAAGVQVGRGTVMMGTPLMYGVGDICRRIHIGENVMINIGCVFDLNAPISIGNHAAIGHEVMLLTSSHHIGNQIHRAGPLTTAPVIIENGTWIGARSVVLPGVTVGAGSVVASGAIVTRNVPPNTLVGGVPARVLRTIDH
jgi:maltose O-acetyltransferase